MTTAKSWQSILLMALAAAALVLTMSVGPASAAHQTGDGAFLCPIVGDGVLHAPGRADAVISTPAGTSFLPGNNQAGANADINALNKLNPSDPAAGPGHNPDFSPIWPGDTFN